MSIEESTYGITCNELEMKATPSTGGNIVRKKMTIEKALYPAPQHETDPGYIDPKELIDIFKQH